MCVLLLLQLLLVLCVMLLLLTGGAAAAAATTEADGRTADRLCPASKMPCTEQDFQKIPLDFVRTPGAHASKFSVLSLLHLYMLISHLTWLF